MPIGIAMSRSDTMQRITIPILDLLQTLPPFVYLIPLIFLFSVTEPKLYGIVIILYAIVPVIRLTDLGIRLVDKEVIEAAEAFGMTKRQKLYGVQIPLALPNIMAGVNQTIMMSLAMVVIASLVSAPGLGVLVLRGIRNLELGHRADCRPRHRHPGGYSGPRNEIGAGAHQRRATTLTGRLAWKQT